MGQRHHHGNGIVEQAAPAARSIRPRLISPELMHPAEAQDDLPGEDAQQVAGPERDGDQEQPQRLVAGDVERDVERDRIARAAP